MGKQKGKTLSAAKALLERGPCDVMLQGFFYFKNNVK